MNIDELSPLEITTQIPFALTINKQILLKAISHVQAIVERKNIINILSHIKLSANENGLLSLTATDMEIEITEVVMAQVSSSGTITVDAANLYDIVRKLPDQGVISLHLDNTINKLKISCSNCKFLLSYLESKNFPSIDYGDKPYHLTFTAADLVKLIDCSKIAISLDESRYNISGVFFHVIDHEEKSFLRAVSTDGHRLSLVELPLTEQVEAIPGIIIPRKTILELRKLLDNSQDIVHLDFSANKIVFKFEHITLISKLLDGTFPDYAELIPQDNQLSLKLNRKAFAEAIDRVSIVAFEKLKTVKLSLSNNLLKLSASGGANESASDEIVVDYHDQDLEIGFNAKYLLEIIQAIPGEEVVCYFSASNNEAVLIKDVTDESLLYVIMPMLVMQAL